ncbi:MAG: 4Fe-4S binding protein [Alphaproteobacteria bacterium]|nr:4Fe-4S binding protein [Alphaproteobacteria bacterium]
MFIQLVRKLLLIDIVKSIISGLDILLRRNIVTKKFRQIQIDSELLSKNTLFIDNTRCIGCKTCMRVCPMKAITVIDSKQYNFQKEYCSQCRLCAKCCPRRAIKFIH